MSTKLIIPLLTFALLLAGGLALAQEETIAMDVTEELVLDEDVQAEDLGVGEPNILPDNPFYFLKEWGRGIQSFFTFNSIKKAELREKFANEKLVEMKKMVEQKKSRERIEKAIENYQSEIGEVEMAAEKIKERAEENEQVGKFLDKFIQHQALHQRVLQKLETQVPEEALERIREARESHLEKFAEVMTKLEDRKEQLQERLENALGEIKGSNFKDFKNLEVLKGLEEKVPEAAKEAIQRAQETSLIRLKGKLEQISPEEQEKFKAYIEKISGEKEKQMEILENLRIETPKLERILIQSREKVIEQIRERAQERECPEIEKPASDFCREGRIVAEKDEQGCIAAFECVIPGELGCETFITCLEGYIPYNTGEKDAYGCPIRKCIKEEEVERPQTCIALWDPVCGNNGKTYSNACFARLAEVKIAYKGKCKETECQIDADCPQLRCGRAGTISARCVGVKAKCVEGKCQIISLSDTE